MDTAKNDNMTNQFEEKLISLLQDIITSEELPAGSLYLLTNPSGATKSICVHEPDYPANSHNVDRVGKNDVFMLLKYEENEVVSLKIRDSYFSDLNIPDSAAKTKKPSDGSFTNILFRTDDLHIFDFIKSVVLIGLERYESTSSFGCCSKFELCSNARKCLHENKLYSKGCKYRKNLESGKIFYGQNTNNSSKEVSHSRDHKGEKLQNFVESYTIIDVETTGFDSSKDYLIEVAALRIRDNQIVDSYSSLINPGVTIPGFISELTGILNSDLSGAPELKDVIAELYNFIGDDVVVGHNVCFDINFIYDRCISILHSPLSNDYIDTLPFARRYLPDQPSYKLSHLVAALNLPHSSFHRALNDCEATFGLYNFLKPRVNNPSEYESNLLSSIIFPEPNPFSGKKVYIRGTIMNYSYNFAKLLLEKSGAKVYCLYVKQVDCIIFGKKTYGSILRGSNNNYYEDAKERGLLIYSETEFYDVFGLKVSTYRNPHKVTSKEIMTSNTAFDETHPLFGKTCVFTGTLERMLRKEAMQHVVDLGGILSDNVTKKTNYLILGNNDYNPLVKNGMSTKQQKAEALKLSGQDIEIITENVFYDMLDM